MSESSIRPRFERLTDYLSRIPPVETDHSPMHGIERGESNGQWWVQFNLDIDHDLAWYAVQELACVLNYLSLEERLPTVFKPISPVPYLNGGPDEFLSWIIECPSTMSPDTVAEWLEGRLPRPVEDEAAWFGEEDDGEDDGDEDDGPTGWIDDET
ncbi:MAG: hypothetical protein ABMA14_11845 [Hyphomonadaceae bacterium]